MDAVTAPLKLAWWRLALVGMLAAATLLLFTMVPRYGDGGPELLVNGDFAAGLKGWQAVGARVAPGTGEAGIANAAPDGYAGITQPVAAPPPGFYRLSAELRSEAVRAGWRDWQRARLLLVVLDRAGQPQWNRQHMAALFAGSHDWRRYQRVFAVPAANGGMLVAAQLSQASGRLDVRHVSLRRVQPLASFAVLWWVLLGAWLLGGLWIATPLLRAARRERRLLPVLGLGAAILAGTLMPHQDKDGLQHQISSLAAPLLPGRVASLVAAPSLPAGVTALLARDPYLPRLDKIGHYLSYAALALAVVLAYGRAWPLVLYLLVCAGTTEVLQNFARARDPLLSDAMINSAGVLTGVVLALAVMWLRRGGRGVAAS